MIKYCTHKHLTKSNKIKKGFKINLQDSHYSLTSNRVGQVLHVGNKITSLRKLLFNH